MATDTPSPCPPQPSPPCHKKSWPTDTGRLARSRGLCVKHYSTPQVHRPHEPRKQCSRSPPAPLPRPSRAPPPAAPPPRPRPAARRGARAQQPTPRGRPPCAEGRASSEAARGSRRPAAAASVGAGRAGAGAWRTRSGCSTSPAAPQRARATLMIFSLVWRHSLLASTGPR